MSVAQQSRSATMAKEERRSTRPQRRPETHRYDEQHEVLVVTLECGKATVVDSSRIAVEASIERLFRAWLFSLLDSWGETADSPFGQDISAFRKVMRSMSLSASANPVAPPAYIVIPITGLPAFVLLEVSSSNFRKQLGVCLLSVSLLSPHAAKEVAIGVAANVIASYFESRPQMEPPIRTVDSRVDVPTSQSLYEFVSYLRVIQMEVESGGASRQTYARLVPLYAAVAEIPNGKVTIEVSLRGNVKVAFELTAQQAIHDLPLLVEKSLAGPTIR